MSITANRKRGRGLAALVGAPDPLVCRKCGSSEWNYTETKTITIDTNTNQVGTAMVAGNALRCANPSCNLKADLNNNAAIRALKLLATAREFLNK